MKKPLKNHFRRSHSLEGDDSLLLYSKDDGDYVNSNYDNIRVRNGGSRSLSPNHHSRQKVQNVGQSFKSISPTKWMKKLHNLKPMSRSISGSECNEQNNENNNLDDCEGGFGCGLKNNYGSISYSHHLSQEISCQHDSNTIRKTDINIMGLEQQQQKQQQHSKNHEITKATSLINESSSNYTSSNIMEDKTENQNAAEYHIKTDENPSGYDEDSSVCTQETNLVDEDTSRLTTIVWKRKSGFSGKMKSGYVKASERANELGEMAKELSMKSVTNFQKLTQSLNPNIHTHNSYYNNTSGPAPSPTSQGGLSSSIKIWEERRIVLEGGILMYYHKDADFNVIDGRETDEVSGSFGGRGPIMAKNKNLAKLKNKFIEISQGTMSGLINTNNQSDTDVAQSTENDQSNTAVSNSAINTPRGLIDLCATNATASVTHMAQHSHAPSPYSLSINVKNEPKWVLCFSSSKELLEWLGALTDISLKQSIQSYEIDHGHAFKDKCKTTKEIEGKHFGAENNMNDIDDLVDDDGENDLERNESTDEITPLLGPEPKFDIPRTTCQPTATCGHGPYSTMAIFNGTLFTLSLALNSVSAIVLMAQSVINGMVWSYYYFTYKKELNTVEGDENDFPSSQLNASSEYTIKSSMKAVTSPKSVSRGRTFSSDDYDVKEKPSFVEVNKIYPPILSNNDPPYKPPAGATMIHFQHESEAINYEGDMIGYISGSSSLLQVRGSQYLHDNKKFPSPTSLYELIEVDAFDSDQHMLDVSTKFKLPTLQFNSPKGSWRAPDLLVISFALPTSPARLGKSSDNKGYIVIGYFKMRDETRNILQIISNSNLSSTQKEQELQELCPNDDERLRINGVKLWEKWCHCAPTDQEMQKRLKFVPRGENLKEIGVPGWICKYNGKPMLIKRPGVTNFVYSHQDGNIIEIDINMHPLPYLFRQAMTYLKEHYFQQMMMTFGFIIEARESDELPEVLLGNPLQLPYVNPANVARSNSVFERPSF